VEDLQIHNNVCFSYLNYDFVSDVRLVGNSFLVYSPVAYTKD